MVTYRLEIDPDKWERFKGQITKNENIDDKIEQLIDRYLEEQDVFINNREQLNDYIDEQITERCSEKESA